jgi:DNA polymerase-3 subunit gamma/tau
LHGRADLGLAPDEYAALTMVLLRILAFKPQAEKKTLAKAEAPSTRAPVTPASPASTLLATKAVQPWEDEPALPPGQVLHVRSSGAPADSNVDEDVEDVGDDTIVARAIAPPAPAAPGVTQVTKVVAVPVREQAEPRSEVIAPPKPVLVPTEEGDFWHATVTQLIATDAINALVRELALQSQLVARDTDQWLLRVERESLNQSGARERLSNALQAAGFGVKLVVEVGRVTDSPSRRNSEASAEKQRAAEKIILEAPFVQAMMRDFGAKIVPGSIKPL